jgi:hypothetical protein
MSDSNFMKMCEEFTPKFGNKRSGCCITAMPAFSKGIFFCQKQHGCYPPTTLLAWFGPLQLSDFPD